MYYVLSLNVDVTQEVENILFETGVRGHSGEERSCTERVINFGVQLLENTFVRRFQPERPRSIYLTHS